MSTDIIHAKGAVILLDEFNFSGLTNEVVLAIPHTLAEVTAFADTDATFVEGKPASRARVNGLWEAVAGGYDVEMFADLTATARRLGIWPDTAAAGKRGYELATIVTGQPRTAPVGGVVALNVDWLSDVAPVRAWSLMNVSGVSATQTGTAYNVGAPTATQTIVGVLRVTAVGGAGVNTLAVTIQSDDAEAFTGPTTQLTFTQVDMTAVAFEVQTSAGALAGETWWRAVATYAGGGTRTFTATVMFGIRPT